MPRERLLRYGAEGQRRDEVEEGGLDGAERVQSRHGSVAEDWGW